MILRMISFLTLIAVMLAVQTPKLSAKAWQQVNDTQTGVQLQLPAGVARSQKSTGYGLNWSSHKRRLNIDTLKFPASQSWETTLYKLRGVKGRTIDSEAHFDGGFTLEGRDRDGTKFIVRIEHRGSETRGISIVYSDRGKPKLDKLARRIYSTFQAFPEGQEQLVSQSSQSGMSPSQNPLNGQYSEPFRFNPPNAEAICRQEYRPMLDSAQHVSVAFPEGSSFASGQTVEIRWDSEQIKPIHRTLHLVIDLPATVEILGEGLQVEDWKEDYDPSTQFGYQPADRSKKRVVIWLGRKSMEEGHHPTTGAFQIRFIKDEATNFGWQVFGSKSYKISSGKANCHPTVLTEYKSVPIKIAPQLERYSKAKTCHFQEQGDRSVAPKVTVTPAANQAKVGDAIAFRWQVESRVNTDCKTPLYLVFTTPERVRFEGDGFFALAPNAPGPFNVQYRKDETRVFVPLHIGDVSRTGNLSVKLYEVGVQNISWSVVEVPQWVPRPLNVSHYDGMSVVTASQAEANHRVNVEPGIPEIVVQDRYSTGAPTRTVFSNSGDYEMQVFETFYRVIELETGELIVQRPGQSPNFSTGSRYVFATLKSSTVAELYDLYARRVVHVLDVEKEGRDGSDIDALAWGANDSFVIVAGDSGVAKFSNILIDREASTLALGSYKARPVYAVAKVNLEGLNLWQQDPWSSGSDSIQNSSLLEVSRENENRYQSSYGLIPIGAPKFNRDIFRWDLGGDTRFAFAHDPKPQSLEEFKNGGQPVSAQEIKKHQKFLSDNERMRQLTIEHLLQRPSLKVAKVTSNRRLIRGNSRADTTTGVSSSQHAIALIEFLSGVNFVGNVEPYSRSGALFKWEQNKQVSTGEPIDEFLEGALEAHINSKAYRDGIKKYQDANGYLENEQPKDWKQVNGRFACEYDVPGELIGEFVVPSRIMARTGWKTGELGTWLIQQDCWGGNGWRAVQLGVLIRERNGHPEFHSFSEPRLSETRTAEMLGINSGKLARGSLTKDGVLLIAMPGRMIEVFDVKSARTIATLENVDDTENTSSLHITPDRKRLLQINEDGKIAIYRIADGKKLLAGYYLDDELVLYNEDGYYLATPEGASFVYFKFAGLKGYHSFHQFSKILNRPSVIQEIMAGQPMGQAKPTVPPPPSIEIVDVSWRGDDRISLRLAATSFNRLRQVNIFADGRLVKGLAASGGSTDLQADIGVLPETHWITAVAIDDNGTESIPRTIPVSDGNSKRSARGTLYAVGVGTNKFNHPQLDDLKFAGNDAKNFIARAQAYSGTYYADVRAQPPVIDAPDLASAIRASLEPVVKKATANDTIMLLVAGHGLQDVQGNFFLAGADTDPNNPATTGGVSWETLASLLKQTKARIVILLDACHSGAAGNSATNDDAVDVLLARNAGQSITVISASKGRQYSSGEPEFEGGLFTTFVNRVGFDAKLRNEVDTNKNGVIEMSEFYLAVKSRVSDYSKGEQTPWITRNQMVGEVPLF